MGFGGWGFGGLGEGVGRFEGLGVGLRGLDFSRVRRFGVLRVRGFEVWGMGGWKVWGLGLGVLVSRFKLFEVLRFLVLGL